MTNSLWVTLHSTSSWHYHHVLLHDQQQVSDNTHFGCQAFLFHLILSPTASKWQCPSSGRYHHHIWPTGSQWDYPIFFKIITSHPLIIACEWLCPFLPVSFHESMTNSKWVTIPILSFRQSCQMPWPTACVWHFFLQDSPITSHPTANSMWVMQPFYLPGSLITSHPIINSKWVMLLFLTEQSHTITSHDQQLVSDNGHFACKTVSLLSIPPGCECYQHLFSHAVKYLITNSQWVTWPIFFLFSDFISRL